MLRAVLGRGGLLVDDPVAGGVGGLILDVAALAFKPVLVLVARVGVAVGVLNDLLVELFADKDPAANGAFLMALALFGISRRLVDDPVAGRMGRLLLDLAAGALLPVVGRVALDRKGMGMVCGKLVDFSLFNGEMADRAFFVLLACRLGRGGLVDDPVAGRVRFLILDLL